MRQKPLRWKGGHASGSMSHCMGGMGHYNRWQEPFCRATVSVKVQGSGKQERAVVS